MLAHPDEGRQVFFSTWWHDRKKRLFESRRYNFANNVETTTVLGTPVVLRISGAFKITDYDEAAPWLNLTIFDLNGGPFVNALYEAYLEPLFWQVYRDRDYFLIICTRRFSQTYIPAADRGLAVDLYHLTLAARTIESCSYRELENDILKQAGLYYGCRIKNLHITWLPVAPDTIKMRAAMVPEKLKAIVRSAAPQFELVESLSLVVEADRLEKVDRVHEVPGLTIKEYAIGNQVHIGWQRTWDEDYLLQVCGYHKTDTLHNIERSENRIVESGEPTGETRHRLSPETKHYFLFRVIGQRPPRWFESLTDDRTVQSDAVTFSVLGPEKVDHLTKAKQAAEIAGWERKLQEHRAAGQSKAERTRKQLDEMLQGRLHKFEVLKEARERFDAQRRAIEQSNLADDVKKQQLEMIDDSEFDFVEAVRAQ